MGSEFDSKFDGGQDEGLREHLQAFRADAAQKAGRPEWFWTAQRASIRERAALPRQARSLQWALGSTLALFAIGASLLMMGPVVPNVATPTTVPNVQANTDDDELMRYVVEATSDTVPDALAPATLLAIEVDRGLKSSVKVKGESR